MTNLLSPLSKWKFWKELIIMTVGMMIAASAVYYFMMPSNLIVGSISGLSLVITRITGWEMSIIVMAINAFLLVLAWLLIGKEFGAKTVYTAMILGPMIDLWDAIYPASKLIPEGATSVMGEPFLDMICFVLVLSLSQTIMFSINASTGGLDILAKIVNKYLHFDIGASVAVAGAIICCTAFAINPFHMVVLGLIGTWINGLTIDYFTASFNRKKRVCIISDEHERIREYIVGKLHRGCSLYPVIGGFSGEEHKEIQVLLTKDEFSDLMAFIRDNKIQSFVTAGNVSEIYGRWANNSHYHRDGHTKA